MWRVDFHTVARTDGGAQSFTERLSLSRNAVAGVYVKVVVEPPVISRMMGMCVQRTDECYKIGE